MGGLPTSKIDPLGLAEMCHRPIQLLPNIVGRHCFLRFNKDDNDTQSFDPNGVHPDLAPKNKDRVCTPTGREDDDDCLKREMKKCEMKGYSFTKFNCCHCIEEALKVCGQSIPVTKWPNYPINPGPQPGESGYMPPAKPFLGEPGFNPWQ